MNRCVISTNHKTNLMNITNLMNYNFELNLNIYLKNFV